MDNVWRTCGNHWDFRRIPNVETSPDQVPWLPWWGADGGLLCRAEPEQKLCDAELYQAWGPGAMLGWRPWFWIWMIWQFHLEKSEFHWNSTSWSVWKLKRSCASPRISHLGFHSRLSHVFPTFSQHFVAGDREAAAEIQRRHGRKFQGRYAGEVWSQFLGAENGCSLQQICKTYIDNVHNVHSI